MSPISQVRIIGHHPFVWPIMALVLFLEFDGFLYFPTFSRPFQGDQFVYTAELEGKTSLGAGLQQFDYNLTRRYWKGDEILFRPFLFVWLALLNFLFGFRYFYWNAAQIVLHAVVSTCLFILLKRENGMGWALLFSLAVSVSGHLIPLNIETHLGGYLWGFAFFLLALNRIFKMERQDAVLSHSDI